MGLFTERDDVNPFDLLEQKTQLHERIVITYMVDGYLAIFESHEQELAEARGDTIVEALTLLQERMK